MWCAIVCYWPTLLTRSRHCRPLGRDSATLRLRPSRTFGGSVLDVGGQVLHPDALFFYGRVEAAKRISATNVCFSRDATLSSEAESAPAERRSR